MKYLKLLSLYFVILINYSYSTPSNNDLFENKVILILGGTGFLGRALITEISKYNPAKIIIYSRDEVKHFNLLKTIPNNSKIQNIIGDIRDEKHLMQVTKNVDIVFHAAALKRIDMLEENVEESIKTNILGSLNVFKACVANNVPKVIFVSTDKACSPVNTYGACKFISEKIFTNYDRTKIYTKFIVARYGNVLDSTGSVIPIFTSRIQKGETLHLTDERMTRFIISKEEAVGLLFDALRYGIGGEVFVKRLPALKVTDLIEVLKEKYGANNKVEIIGLRPGEKIHEELINETEAPRVILFDQFFIICPSVTYDLCIKEMPAYMQGGSTISYDTLNGYRSDQAVISKDKLSELFNRLNFL